MAQTSVLLALPAEIRNQIAEYIFHREPGTTLLPPHKSPLAFASTCRQLYFEFYALARSATVFTMQWPHGRVFVPRIIWAILRERHMDRLTKICIVHDGVQPYLSLPTLYSMMQFYQPYQTSKLWEARSDLVHGRLLFVGRRQGPDQAARQVSLFIGYSFREAEQYVAVCEQIGQEQYADILLARRRDCSCVTPFSDMSDEQVRNELDYLRVQYPIFDDVEHVFQPHVDEIRARCSQAS
ncbi:thiamine pyrophosphokinase [Pyrenophora seminiperda CCB06]|uniref:Thiamine pyrophosphokinase n=1 Tax=Pyrenophora seminiperda CCB06 TaxID=1302712 RepID=A0A3M7MBW5_9PLEO|nr:thiamine pyrophosphokinase [Pyrenophora seminiperda CCB06]